MFAVIKTGGKQYLVEPGTKLKIEKVGKPSSASASAKASADKKATEGKEEGKEITFKEVLLLEKNRKLEIGTPFVKGAKVIAKVLKQGKDMVEKIGKFKKENNLPILNSEREKEIFSRLEKLAEEKGLNKNFVKELFGLIIKQSKIEQK